MESNINTFGRTMINLLEVQEWLDDLEEGEELPLWYDGKEFYPYGPEGAHWIADFEKGESLAFIAEITHNIMTDIEKELY